MNMESQLKTKQWLGAALDGGSMENDPLLVCAPRLQANRSYSQHLSMNGICYLAPDTKDDASNKIDDVQTISLFSNFYRQDEGTYNYLFSQQGLSAHVTDAHELLMGAPACNYYEGAVAVCSSNSATNCTILNTDKLHRSRDSYFGFATTSGRFGGKRKILYLASAPLAKLRRGVVHLFDYENITIDNNVRNSTINIYHTFSTNETGSYYGYAIVAEDFDGDNLTDIAISAPYYGADTGIVYVFKNLDRSRATRAGTTWKANFSEPNVLKIKGSGNFGMAMSSIGDINRDGYNGYYNFDYFI